MEGGAVLVVAEIAGRAPPGENPAAGAGCAVRVEHGVDAAAVGVAEGEGVVEVVAPEEEFFLVVGGEGTLSRRAPRGMRM